MDANQLTPEVITQLETYVANGDAASYYSTLASNGHEYGNLAYDINMCQK